MSRHDDAETSPSAAQGAQEGAFAEEQGAADAQLAAWLRLTLTPGIGGAGQRALLAQFGLPAHLFHVGRPALSQVLTAKQTDALLSDVADQAVATALAWRAQAGNHILTLADAEYPQSLLEIADPPTVLYVKGRLDLLNRPALALVGSRNATAQGLANAEAFAEVLARGGLTIISGLALGIDAAAHRGALQAREADAGSTVAVIGTGADRIYPAGNQELARAIAERGTLISEFPLGTPAIAANFPRRNRIISGLARGVLVVEAAERSGSLITARLAGEQGRDVFAIPGSIHSPLSKGCHRLIKQGAKLVDDARDILEEMAFTLGAVPQRLAVSRPAAYSPSRPPAAVPPRAEPAASADDDPLLNLLGFDPCTLDALVARSGMTLQVLSGQLLQLELEGRVVTLPGGRYQRTP